jgi:hypothetical protein
MKETIPTLILCMAALQSDPGLVATNKKLLKQKQSLDVKVDAALAKADPALAPFIKKLQKRDGGQESMPGE